MKAIICGAGIAGLALAQRLLAIGWEPIVVEQAPGPRAQGYMIDFFGPGYQATARMGVGGRVDELGYKIKQFGYVDKTGEVKARIDYQRFAATISGKMVSIMRPDLETALREPVEDKVDIRYGQTITRIDNSPRGVSALLSDGTTVDADLLVGADGIHSQTRTAVFGPESKYLRFLGYHTAAYLFTDAEVHRLVGDGFFMTDTVNRQMGFYGLRDGRVAVFLVHRTANLGLPADPRSVIRRTYADVGWVAGKALEYCPDNEYIYYDQVAQVEMPQWTKHRVTLLGDANYAVSLLAGQGASLGIAGAYVLARQLETAPGVDTALREYRDRWHPVVTERQYVGRRSARWFVPGSPTQLRLRRLAVRAMGLPILDRWLGSGLVGKSHADVEETATGL